MSTTRRTYSSEFKSEAVELAARSGRSIAEVERELGLSEGLLKQWVRKAKQDGVAALLLTQDEDGAGVVHNQAIAFFASTPSIGCTGRAVICPGCPMSTVPSPRTSARCATWRWRA